jgi:hypothetical protein
MSEDIPGVPFFKKVAETPLLMGNFTPIQLILSVVMLVVVVIGGLALGAMLSGLICGAMVFFGAWMVCGVINTRKPRGWVIHRVTEYYAPKAYAPCKGEWHPITAPDPRKEKLKKTRNV